MSMTGEEMRGIREALGMSQAQFGNALGYTNGSYDTTVGNVRRYEGGGREIPPWIETRVRAMHLEGLREFIRSYRGGDDQAEFVLQLSKYLLEGRPAP